jgi:hypothetical protein
VAKYGAAVEMHLQLRQQAATRPPATAAAYPLGTGERADATAMPPDLTTKQLAPPACLLAQLAPLSSRVAAMEMEQAHHALSAPAGGGCAPAGLIGGTRLKTGESGGVGRNDGDPQRAASR